MQKKIKRLKIEVLIVTLLQLAFVGVFLTLYLFDTWNMDSVILPETMAYIFSFLAIADCFYIWRIIFGILNNRQKRDITTGDAIGSGIEEAYLFGNLGFMIVDETGTVLWESDLLLQRQENVIDESIYEWCPQLKNLLDKDVGNVININLNGIAYSVKFLRNAGLFIFKDVSEYEDLRKSFVNQATCIGIMNIDNYNDVTATSESNTDLIAKVKLEINKYANKYRLLLRSVRNDSYFIVCNYQDLEAVKKDKFSILDKVRQIGEEDKTSVTPTLSIGFAHDFPDVNKLNEMASTAIEIAMSRGGDQAVVQKFGSEIEYYGGKTEAQENTSKVKIRVFANSLLNLIRKSSDVIIMGHKNSDMDSLGSCLGVKELCDYCDKKARVIYDFQSIEKKTSIVLKGQFTSEEFKNTFITGAEALKVVKNTTLVIVCDVSRPKMTLCPELLEKTEKVCIIDHHRRAEDFIEKPVIYLIETSASSASELIVEISKYNSEKQTIKFSPKIATIMLAGIFVDTNFYKTKTVGARTFEASSILKECGADNGAADNYLKDEYKEFVTVNSFLNNLKTVSYGIVICQGKEDETYDSTTIAKAANGCIQLNGINAAFAFARINDDVIHISGRSDGTVNVQILCEKLGGGGHFAMAAAQIKNKTMKEVEDLLTETILENADSARKSREKGR